MIGAMALGGAVWSPAHGVPPIHHDLTVTVEPERGRLAVRDRITLPPGPAEPWLRFTLHPALQVRAPDPGTAVRPVGGARSGPRAYRLTSDPRRRTVTLEYTGRIVEPPRARPGVKGGLRETSGTISENGVYLDAASHWYPQFAGPWVTFDLKVHLPEGWSAVSQGQALPVPGASAWRTRDPQDSIYLVAGPFTRYQKVSDWGTALVHLRRADEALAQRYLQATAGYLALYSRLIGPYPYAKFALVENFWETGYGMPSFTLLGPRVLRLPFIVHTSYPHEILHNWWGNSVYVDYASGNWAEGLTSYLADHLMAERRGQGAEHRRGVLQKYVDFVAEGRDFPLRQFRARHGEVTQAVGYSKGLMLFHMLRRRLGDAAFVRGLRRFYREQRFRRAGFDDLRAAMEAEGGTDLSAFFHQWLERTGAPALQVRDVSVVPAPPGTRVRGRLVQAQEGAAYVLQVPVVVQLAGAARPFEAEVAMDAKEVSFDLLVPGEPVRVAADPAFDLFRRLHREELPPSLGQVFGAERALFVLPSAPDQAQRSACRELAEAWAGSYAEADIALDRALQRLPDDRAVWLLGWDNRFRPRFAAALGERARLTAGEAAWDGYTWRRPEHALALVARDPDQPDRALGWVGAPAGALAGLARKLPHYSRYSFAVFEGRAPDNVLKGQWPVGRSPLQVNLTEGEPPPLVLPERPALTAVLDTLDSPRPQR